MAGNQPAEEGMGIKDLKTKEGIEGAKEEATKERTGGGGSTEEQRKEEAQTKRRRC